MEIKSKIVLMLLIAFAIISSIGVCSAQEIDVNQTDNLELKSAVPATDTSQKLLSVANSRENYSTSGNGENEVLSDAYLVLDNDADKENVKVGEYVTWIFKAKNFGPDTAENTKVHVKLPDGLKYIKHTTNKGVFNPKTGIWNIGNLSIYDTFVELFITTKALTLGEKVAKAFITSDTPNSNNVTYEEEEIDVESDGDSVGYEKQVSSSTKMHETGNPILLILASLFVLFIPIFKK